MDKYKVVALFGKSGAGKDTLLNEVLKDEESQSLNLHKLILSTTRPPREGEEEGEAYFFLTQEQACKKITDDEMLIGIKYREWFYGLESKALASDKVNIGVFSIEEINLMLEEGCFDVLPIEIHANDSTRLTRAIHREENPDCSEICRRFLSDEKDFLNIDFDYLRCANYLLNIAKYDIMAMILHWLQQGQE